jgi:hypothetical protein
MDGSTDLIRAIETNDAWLVVGAMLLAITSMIRAHLEPRLPEGAARDWSSAVSAVAAGLGVALLSGAIWWQALLICLLAAPTSAGLWRLVADAITRGKP